jgi:methyltransferase
VTSPLAWVLALTVASRLAELALAARNTARLRAAGWREVDAGAYPLFVALHASLLIALACTASWSAMPIWPLIGVLALLHASRFWIIASLGPHWTTRLLTRDDACLVRQGPYRFLRHPAYLTASLEIAVLPLAFRDWPVALVWSALNGPLVWRRIRQEDAALAPRRAGE